MLLKSEIFKYMQAILPSHRTPYNSHWRLYKGQVYFLTLEPKANLAELKYNEDRRRYKAGFSITMKLFSQGLKGTTHPQITGCDVNSPSSLVH